MLHSFDSQPFSAVKYSEDKWLYETAAKLINPITQVWSQNPNLYVKCAASLRHNRSLAREICKLYHHRCVVDLILRSSSPSVNYLEFFRFLALLVGGTLVPGSILSSIHTCSAPCVSLEFPGYVKLYTGVSTTIECSSLSTWMAQNREENLLANCIATISKIISLFLRIKDSSDRCLLILSYLYFERHFAIFVSLTLFLNSIHIALSRIYYLFRSFYSFERTNVV